jgi:hypothetical protein
MRARSARITQFPVFLPSPIFGEGLGVGHFKKALHLAASQPVIFRLIRYNPLIIGIPVFRSAFR